MADVQITCINKMPRDDTHHGITHLGNSQGKWTRAQVIQWITSKEHRFFTIVNGNRADVGVHDDKMRAPYLRTYADNQWNNNLLALPECP